MSATEAILAQIGDERVRQHAKWGEQDHPDGTGPQSVPLRRIVYNGVVCPENGSKHYAFGLRLMAKQATDNATANGEVSFADILLEEVFEALAESDPAELRTELVQVAAVAAQWVEAIDRRNAREAEPTVALAELANCQHATYREMRETPAEYCENPAAFDSDYCAKHGGDE